MGNMSCNEIYDEVIKDLTYYGEWNLGKGRADESFLTESSQNRHGLTIDDLDSLAGGVTFSGGEALLQANNLEPLFRRLKAEHIHMAVETCLFVPEDKLRLVLKYINLFYVDIKILDAVMSKDVLCGNLDLFFKNIEILFSSGRPVVFRLPVISGYTDGVDNRRKVVELLQRYKPIKVELIKEHNLGISKYESLSLPVPNNKGTSDEMMEDYKKEIEEIGILAEVCKI